ncbi:MAG TPA: hypothetical protein VMF89_00890, partial [Polyangiales bacterium]|nr:hypothetical protein [Polyangiales bacterium]
SANVPRLNADNLWLRFSVRLMDALFELAHGQPDARIWLGDPGRSADELRLMNTHDSELTSKLGEARLLPSEIAMLDRLRERLLSSSRSALLRQALMTCASICQHVAQGVSVWVECEAVPRPLPDLVQLAAELGQPSEESRALCSHQALNWPAEVRARLGVSGKADYCRISELVDRLESSHYEVASFELTVPELDATLRCTLRRGQQPSVELAPKRRSGPAVRTDVQQIGRTCPAPPGEWRHRGPSDALGVGEQTQCILP